MFQGSPSQSLQVPFGVQGIRLRGQGGAGDGDAGGFALELPIDGSAPQVVHDMDRNRYESIEEPLVGGNRGGAEELVGKAVVFLLSNQKVRVVHPENGAGKGHLVTGGFHVQYGAVELS